MSYLNDDDDFACLSAENEADEKEEVGFVMSVGVWAAPVIVIHLSIIYFFISAQTGWRLSNVITQTFVPFFWVGGPLLAFTIYYWRKGGFPVADRIRLTGWKGRYFIIAFVLGSFAEFIAPQMIGDILQMIASWFR